MIYSSNKELDIILDSNKNNLLLWGNKVHISQPYDMKIRTFPKLKVETLQIEFKTFHHEKYSEDLFWEIRRYTDEQKIIRVRQYQNKENNPGIRLFIASPHYNFRVT